MWAISREKPPLQQLYSKKGGKLIFEGGSTCINGTPFEKTKTCLPHTQLAL